MSGAADAETTRVEVTTSALRVVVGRGAIRYVADATLVVGDIEIRMCGFTIRTERTPDGMPIMAVCVPAYRDPSVGVWRDAIALPREVEDAIARALLSQLPGGGANAVFPLNRDRGA